MIQNSNKQQGNALLIILITILAIAILGTLGYLFYQNFVVKDKQSEASASNETQQEVTSVTKEFKSQEHGITFNYPEGWSVTEEQQEGNTADWYASSINIVNAEGVSVAGLNTGGQLGGLCDDEAPLISTSTIIKDPLDLKGVGKTNFGYTIVETSTDNYGIAFGLAKDDLPSGDKAVQCPGMSVNYRYNISSNTQALGGITFGRWYTETQSTDNMNTHRTFKSFEEAKAYAQSDEFKQIKKMIESLSING